MESQPATCFVGLFDIIGFKELRQALGTAELMKKYERAILPLIQHSAAGRHKTEDRDGQQVSVPDFHEHSAQYRVFSDTVIFWTKDDSFLSFLIIVTASSQLAAVGFALRSPFRGAIGHGDLLENREIIVGSGIEDAYIWEQRQAWAGVSLTPDCEEFCVRNGYLEGRRREFLEAVERADDAHEKAKFLKEVRRLVRYPVPLQTNPKDGPVTYSSRDSIALDWTLNVFEGAAEKSMDKPRSSHAHSIKDNTLSFEKWARAQS
jgi:hypothetical protein